MRNTISVMNAKGGVGKSTLVLTIAETMSAHFGKRVLVIDSDAHASISNMLMAPDWLETIQQQRRTIVDFLIANVLHGAATNWRAFLTGGVSDVDDATSIDLMAGGGHLTLFEREVSKSNQEVAMRYAVRALLAEIGAAYDLVLIDSAPGLSVLTECWLRECDFYLAPTKPDYISTHGLQFLRQFRQRDTDMAFAEPLGVIINMKDANSTEDERFARWLHHNGGNRCFEQAVPRANAFQTAAHFSPRARSYWAKYPGAAGRTLKLLCAEMLQRLATMQPPATMADVQAKGVHAFMRIDKSGS
ncbi:MAG: ParA family protein [Hyphomicrobiaceae bacterium]|jgi:chromosome partitioning protein